MKVFTIGYTQKSAEEFFTLLKHPDIVRIVDVRLNNVSQLAGFTKKNNLEYFLKEICDKEYIHRLDLAPTKDMLDEYKENHDWSHYVTVFTELLRQRDISNTFPEELIDGSCFLCAEPTPENCHRRLVVECLQRKWSGLDIVHL